MSTESRGAQPHQTRSDITGPTVSRVCREGHHDFCAIPLCSCPCHKESEGDPMSHETAPRQECKHCHLRIYLDEAHVPFSPRWRHHGSNLRECYITFAEPSAVPESTADELSLHDLAELEQQWHSMKNDPYFPSNQTEWKLIQMAKRYAEARAGAHPQPTDDAAESEYQALRQQMLREVGFWQGEHARVVAILNEAHPSLGEAAQPQGMCLLCHHEPDYVKGSNLPSQHQEGMPWVCAECSKRLKTVDSFGLTVEELRKAALAYKKWWENGGYQKSAIAQSFEFSDAPQHDNGCKSPYHRPTSMYCLDCIPTDAPLAVLLLSNRQPTEREIARGLELAKAHGWLDKKSTDAPQPEGKA